MNFWAGGLPHYAGIEINSPIAKRRALFVWFLHKAEPHARRVLANPRNEIRAEVFYKTFTGTQCERPH
jgi:hypothetical protein